MTKKRERKEKKVGKSSDCSRNRLYIPLDTGTQLWFRFLSGSLHKFDKRNLYHLSAQMNDHTHVARLLHVHQVEDLQQYPNRQNKVVGVRQEFGNNRKLDNKK